MSYFKERCCINVKKIGKRFASAFSPLVSSLLYAFLCFPLLLFALHADPGTHPDFGGIPKKISIQRGTAVSSWLDRGDVVKSATMTPVGDGTWEYYVNLTAGATYNFMFFAVPTGTVTGLTQGATYYDTAPSGYTGKISFPTSTSSTTITGTQTGYYGKAGGSDDRRLVHIPQGGSTYYVFCNFGHTPNPPSNVFAMPTGGTHITLSWNYPKDSWGMTDLADVVAGGRYFIYRSSAGAGGPYALVVSTTGSAVQYKDTGLTTGVTYYYVMVSSDAYRGPTKTGKVSQGGIDENFVMTFPDVSQTSAKPAYAITVIFKVERIEEKYKIDGVDYSKIGDNALVYLTPCDEDGKFYSGKIMGRITSVYLPPD